MFAAIGVTGSEGGATKHTRGIVEHKVITNLRCVNGDKSFFPQWHQRLTLGWLILVPEGFQAQWREHRAVHGVPFRVSFRSPLVCFFIRAARPDFGRSGGRSEGSGRPATYSSPKCKWLGRPGHLRFTEV